jgi:hypothetical protein
MTRGGGRLVIAGGLGASFAFAPLPAAAGASSGGAGCGAGTAVTAIGGSAGSFGTAGSACSDVALAGARGAGSSLPPEATPTAATSNTTAVAPRPIQRGRLERFTNLSGSSSSEGKVCGAGNAGATGAVGTGCTATGDVKSGPPDSQEGRNCAARRSKSAPVGDGFVGLPSTSPKCVPVPQMAHRPRKKSERAGRAIGG